MRKPLIPLTMLFAAIAAFAAFAAWGFHQSVEGGFDWTGVGPVVPYLLAGTLTVGAVIVVFVWLAGFSERRGYDRRAASDRRG
jgi:fatty acid desaturase